ncbi:MAG: peptidoglycan-binding protein [Alphaproteobacteria bacterium]|nr:peptidoglycan-binding protein [Alphaproteobacteria bacterium]
MTKFILATASALALGIAGSGLASAADNTSLRNSSGAPAASAGSSAQTPNTMPQSEANETAPASQSQIKQLQQQLKAAGLYKGKVDGKMGRETKQAISQFQQQNGLQTTGKLDQQTLVAMNNNNSNNNTNGYGSSTNTNTPSPGAGGMNNHSSR